jgi:hypothetical protein
MFSVQCKINYFQVGDTNTESAGSTWNLGYFEKTCFRIDKKLRESCKITFQLISTKVSKIQFSRGLKTVLVIIFQCKVQFQVSKRISAYFYVVLVIFY